MSKKLLIILFILLLVISNLLTLMAVNSIISEENWMQIPITVQNGSDTVSVGTLIVSDKTGECVYKDKEGQSFCNDWYKIASDIMTVAMPKVKK